MVKVPPDGERSYNDETTEWQPMGLLRLRFENYLNVLIRREWRLKSPIGTARFTAYAKLPNERAKRQFLIKQLGLAVQFAEPVLQRQPRSLPDKSRVFEGGAAGDDSAPCAAPGAPPHEAHAAR